MEDSSDRGTEGQSGMKADYGSPVRCCEGSLVAKGALPDPPLLVNDTSGLRWLHGRERSDENTATEGTVYEDVHTSLLLQ